MRLTSHSQSRQSRRLIEIKLFHGVAQLIAVPEGFV